MLAIRTIAYPADCSAVAHRAFEVAGALARDYKARRVLWHVHEPPVPMAELVPTAKTAARAGASTDSE